MKVSIYSLSGSYSFAVFRARDDEISDAWLAGTTTSNMASLCCACSPILQREERNKLLDENENMKMIVALEPECRIKNFENLHG